MSLLEVPVVEARAVLDEDAGTFTIEVRMADGTDVSFSSQPGPGTIAALKSSLERSAAVAEGIEVEELPKPKRKRARKPKPEVQA